VRSEKERVRDMVCQVLEDQAVTFAEGNSVLVMHCAERRKRIEFVADIVTSRATKVYAGSSPDAAEIRGLQLLRLHLDEGGHDWSHGTDMADVGAARAWLDRQVSP
jgi:hypothetical protein